MRISCALVLIAGMAAAQPAPKKKAGKKTELGALVTALVGVDDEAAAKAAGELGDVAEPAAHDALLDGLAFGLRPAVAVEAIGALAHHPAPPDVVSLVRYAGHHNPSVRGIALATLAAYPDPVAKA